MPNNNLFFDGRTAVVIREVRMMKRVFARLAGADRSIRPLARVRALRTNLDGWGS